MKEKRFHSILTVRDQDRRGEHGVAIIAVMIAIPALLGLTFVGVELGHLAMVKDELVTAADAAALAGAQALPDEVAAVNDAQTINLANYGTATHQLSVILGRWDAQARTFTANSDPANAVKVTTRRSSLANNPLQLILGDFIGVPTADVEAVAVATKDDDDGQNRFRFLIDDEMFDTDIPVIEQAAEDLGFPSSEAMLTDNNGDWFIDIPPGTELELPTGQVGDEALFAIDEEVFEFSQSSNPSLEDFLNYNEDGSWRQDTVPTSMLDPMLGAVPLSDAGQYGGLVNPDAVLVSPVFKSDVSDASGNPCSDCQSVNALGFRRGLVAFSIVGVGDDPDGSGSKLPNLIIEIVDPSGIDLAGVSPEDGGAGGGGSAKLVM